ncbi:unnamed protein product [Chrysoparadoxa australica]
MVLSVLRHRFRWRLLSLMLVTLTLAACGRGEAPAPSATDWPDAVVYKSPTCGCCTEWVEHLRANGFPVQVREPDDLNAVKDRLGVPNDMRSCHTAEIDGYVIEGHVPAADIQRLLRRRPRAKGLAVPGMPLGSPGMEVDDRRQAYTVWLLQGDGKASFADYPARNL